jgi:hypothetical protein
VRSARDAMQRAIAAKDEALARQLGTMLQEFEQEQAGGGNGSLP